MIRPSGLQLTTAPRRHRIASLRVHSLSRRRRHGLEHQRLVHRDLLLRLLLSCNFSLANGADYDYCRVALVFNLTEGNVDGTDVGGLGVAAVVDTPKVMTDGNWRLGVFIDESASDEQAEKLLGVFSGQLGGPMEGVVPLVGENLGMERARFEIQEEGLSHSVKVGDTIDFEIEDVVPFGIETGEPVRIAGIFHPAGSDFTVSKPTRARINAFGIEFEGKSGLSTSGFSWAA
jgi:hypothetical protein